MAWVAAIVIIAVLSLLMLDYTSRFPGDQRFGFHKWYVGWIAKGIVLPCGIWILFNSGIVSRLPSLTMDTDHARVIARGALVIATYWAGLTSAWLLLQFYRWSDAQPEYRHYVVMWSILLGPFAGLITLGGGWYFLGLGMTMWFMPLLLVVNLMEPRAGMRKPSYSRAIAQMHRDRYDEAELAVINELEKVEDDFDGWMLLAELYAVHFHDLAGAERTIMDTCANPTTTDSQRSVALHKLADWHLKLANDPVAARDDMEMLCQFAPNTHLARMAQHRLNQIPASREEWTRQQKGKTFRLPSLRKDFDAETTESASNSELEAEAVQRAKRLSQSLQANPNDAGARAELAIILAEKLGKIDAGLEQVRLLLTLSGQPDEKRVEWLALIASWQLKFKRDESAARQILEQIVRDHGQSAQAFAAQRRLNLMDLDLKIRARASGSSLPKVGLLPSQ